MNKSGIFPLLFIIYYFCNQQNLHPHTYETTQNPFTIYIQSIHLSI